MLKHIENSKLSIVDYVMKTNRNARNVFEEDEEDETGLSVYAP